eukprot:scaffold305081_cov17-Tisochrysis_lutea.AAC.2
MATFKPRSHLFVLLLFSQCRVCAEAIPRDHWQPFTVSHFGAFLLGEPLTLVTHFRGPYAVSCSFIAGMFFTYKSYIRKRPSMKATDRQTVRKIEVCVKTAKWYEIAVKGRQIESHKGARVLERALKREEDL